MIGLLFAVACWATWYLSPHNVSLLVFDKEAIINGEWWRLWSVHFTHLKFSQLVLNSGIIALMGLMLGRFTKLWHLFLSLLVAMPIMTGLLLLMPSLVFYKGSFGLVAMMVMMGVCFLILESKRFSLGYWIGWLLLLLFAGKVVMETWIMFLASVNKHHAGLHVRWLIQCFGVLLGLAFFNALHQIYATSTAKNKHYRGASVDKRHSVIR